MPMSGQPMRGFQPNQPYGVQGYAPQQLQVKMNILFSVSIHISVELLHICVGFTQYQ